MLPLIELIRTHAPIEWDEAKGSLQVTGITQDSRQVKAGTVFVAIPGTVQNGEDYIEKAIALGAAAVVCRAEAAGRVNGATPVVVENPRLALAKYAASFYAPQPSRVVAVTGTDGKSSTVEFTRQLWEKFGKPAAAMGTLGLKTIHPVQDAGIQHTTPDAVTLHRQLKACSEAGVNSVALEASSHGLDQYRMEGVILDAAAFTTFGEDHRDYHPTTGEYWAAKARLFEELLPTGGWVILNGDDPRIAALAMQALTRGQVVLTFGRNGRALRLESARPVPQGLEVHLKLEGVEWRGVIPLYGEFQVMNILAACGLVLPDAPGTEKMLFQLPSLEGVRGRLEKVASHPSGAPVFVDYAHTPQALKNILIALRSHTTGKLSVVFGCGGDRDKQKRPEMGKIAQDFADRIIVTDDNPRTEDPASIRAAILAECPDAIECGDRKQAIQRGLEELKAGDLMVVAGKGHEATQTIGKETFPFNDAEVIRSLLGEKARELA